MSDLIGKTALVTGASRGIGASVALMLAERGIDVAINYRSKGPRAEEVAEAVRALGRRALLVQADLTSEEEMHAMMDSIAQDFGHLNYLVLNASGGLEKDKAVDYAMQLNLTAQVRALDLALPLMPVGSRVVFVTSHVAHFHGEKSGFPGYETVAASKKAGENALRARIPQLTKLGISLVVVSGDLIEGTITPKLLARSIPGLIESRRAQAGTLPTVEVFAQAIVEAVRNPDLQSGATIFVGSTDWE